MTRRRLLGGGVERLRLRPVLARVGVLLALAVAVMLTVRCTRELAPSQGDGGLALVWRSEAGATLAGADSVRTWVLDSQELILVGPVVAPFDTATGSFDITLRVPAGDDRAVRMHLEGPGARGRGVVAEGETRGISVPVAGTAEALLRLRNAVPMPEPFTGQPGDLEVTLRWSSVAGAVSYRVYGRWPGCEEQVVEVADTLDVVSDPPWVNGCGKSARAGSFRGNPAPSRGWPRPSVGHPSAPAAGGVLRSPAVLDTTWFWVSAILHGGAVSVTSDAVAVSFDWIESLPRVTAVVPAPESVGVPDSAAVEIAFDRPMDPSTLGDVGHPSDSDAVMLRVDGAAELVAFTVDSSSWRDGGRRLHLRPVTPLLRDATYLLQVTTGILDLDGRPLDQSPDEAGLQGFESRFDTELYDPLRVTGMVPPDGATDVPTQPVLDVQLNRSARATTVNAQTVLLADSAGSAVTCVVTQPQPSRIRVTPALPLRFSTGYQFTVTTGVRDMRGSEGDSLDQDPVLAGAQPFAASFRTVPQPNGPRVLAVTPPDGAGSVPLGLEVRVRFSRPVQVASIPGNLTVQLPSHVALSGPFVPSADRTEFVFTSTRFERGVTYTVVAEAAGLDSQGNPFGIRDDLGIPFDQDSTVAGYQGFTSRFRVEDSPRVSSVAPGDGRDHVPVDTLVTLRFSLPVARNSVRLENLALYDGAALVPLRALEWNGDSTLVRLQPEGSLSFYRSYTVLADTSLRSTRGSRFDQNPAQAGYQPFRSSFLTAADGIPPRVASWSPGPGATGVPAVAPVTVRFTKPVVIGSVLRAENFFLRRRGSDFRVEATRTMTADSLEATLRPSAPLESDAAYEVTVTKFVEDRFGQQLDQDPLLPFNQDFADSFRTEIEHVSPRVTSVEPADSTEGVRRSATIKVTFSEPMGSSGLIDAFSLTGPDGPVAGTPGLSLDRTWLEFAPSESLRQAVAFRVRVDTTATDLAGNHLDQYPETPGREPFESSFTTASDQEPPRVVISVPAAGDTAVEVTVRPEVTFNERMAPATLAAGVRLLDPEGAVVSTEFESAIDLRSATLTPADSLRFSALYTLEVTEAAQDTSGNGLDQNPAEPGSQPFRISFRTRSENIPPRVRHLAFDGGPPVPIASQIRVVFDEAIDPSTVTAQTVRLLLGGSTLDAAVSLSAPDTALVVPAVPLLFDMTYTVTVAGVGDLRGNLLDQDPMLPGAQAFADTFRTVPDLVSPWVAAVFPPDSSTGVDPGVVVEIRFSEPVIPATVVLPAFAVYNTAGGAAVPGTITPVTDDTVFSYRPDAPLTRGASFLVQVDGRCERPRGQPAGLGSGHAGLPAVHIRVRYRHAAPRLGGAWYL